MNSIPATEHVHFNNDLLSKNMLDYELSEEGGLKVDPADDDMTDILSQQDGDDMKDVVSELELDHAQRSSSRPTAVHTPPADTMLNETSGDEDAQKPRANTKQKRYRKIYPWTPTTQRRTSHQKTPVPRTKSERPETPQPSEVRFSKEQEESNEQKTSKNPKRSERLKHKNDPDFEPEFYREALETYKPTVERKAEAKQRKEQLRLAAEEIRERLEAEEKAAKRRRKSLRAPSKIPGEPPNYVIPKFGDLPRPQRIGTSIRSREGTAAPRSRGNTVPPESATQYKPLPAQVLTPSKSKRGKRKTATVDESSARDATNKERPTKRQRGPTSRTPRAPKKTDASTLPTPDSGKRAPGASKKSENVFDPTATPSKPSAASAGLPDQRESPEMSIESHNPQALKDAVEGMFKDSNPQIASIVASVPESVVTKAITASTEAASRGDDPRTAVNTALNAVLSELSNSQASVAPIVTQAASSFVRGTDFDANVAMSSVRPVSAGAVSTEKSTHRELDTAVNDGSASSSDSQHSNPTFSNGVASATVGANSSRPSTPPNKTIPLKTPGAPGRSTYARRPNGLNGRDGSPCPNPRQNGFGSQGNPPPNPLGDSFGTINHKHEPDKRGFRSWTSKEVAPSHIQVKIAAVTRSSDPRTLAARRALFDYFSKSQSAFKDLDSSAKALLANMLAAYQEAKPMIDTVPSMSTAASIHGAL